MTCTWRCCSAEAHPEFCDGDVRLCRYHGLLVLMCEVAPDTLLLPSSYWQALRGLPDER